MRKLYFIGGAIFLALAVIVSILIYLSVDHFSLRILFVAPFAIIGICLTGVAKWGSDEFIAYRFGKV